MIASESEYRAARGELQSLENLLAQVEHGPDHPNKDLSIIGVYKKMHRLWEELEEYYQGRLSALETETPSHQCPKVTSGVRSD